ncbi:hypothetical protein ACN28S_50685 [Cystobacter fuscus]
MERAEQVAREDLVMFVNACFSCTGQREFYNDARGQSVSIEFLHAYILGNYRRLYARTLAAGINHFNQGQIILNLLATGKQTPAEDRREEGALIAASLRALPPQRAFRVLEVLRERRINNRRARAIAREYLEGREDPSFDAVKYRSKLRATVAHGHLKLAGELNAFLFHGWRKRVFKTPLLETFRRAHYEQAALFELPFTIAEGLAVKHGIARDVFLERIEPRLTAGERLRLQGAAARQEGAIAIDLGKAPLTKLALYLLAMKPETRRERQAELHAALERAALRTLRRGTVPLGRVATVLDNSYSASGSTEKRRRPWAWRSPRTTSCPPWPASTAPSGPRPRRRRCSSRPGDRRTSPRRCSMPWTGARSWSSSCPMATTTIRPMPWPSSPACSARSWIPRAAPPSST